jgi:choline/ethanolamine kinase
LYACSIDETSFKQIDREPNNILLRLYGENNNKNSSVLLKDVVVSAMMSDNQLGPKLYGIFPSGRLEQLIDATSMNLSDMFDPDLSREIAKVTAKFHTLEMPFIKEPHWLFDTTAKYLRKIKDIQFTNEKDMKMFQQLQTFNFEEEFKQLKLVFIYSKIILFEVARLTNLIFLEFLFLSIDKSLFRSIHQLSFVITT